MSEVISEYQAAIKNTAHLELAVAELELTFERWLESKLPASILQEFRSFQSTIQQQKENIKSARKWQADKKTELVEYAAASGLNGRELHKHVLIAETTEVLFEDVGQAALWLCSVGRSEDVTIKTWKIQWYRDHAANKTLPDFIKLCNVPLIKIDSVWD